MRKKRLRLYRFMSAEEYEKLIGGEKLTNETVHADHGRHTDAVGFCWTPVPPFQSIRFLVGIVDPAYCVCAIFPAGKVRKCRGKYAVGNGWKNEYCCTSYSLDDIELIYASREWSHLPNKKESDALLKEFFGLEPTDR